MKKLLFLCLFALTFCSGFAQSQKPQENDQALVQRIDSLEHELSYLKLSYDLYTLNSDMKMAASEIYAKYLVVREDINHRIFDKELGNAYKRYYKICEGQRESFDRLIKAKKNYFAIKVATYPYSENEMGVLKASYDLIDNAYDSLESSIELLKMALDTYYKFI